jgi:hypothetical protein
MNDLPRHALSRGEAQQRDEEIFDWHCRGCCKPGGKSG